MSDSPTQDAITIQLYQAEDGSTGMAVDLGGYSGEDWDGTGPGAIAGFILDQLATHGIIDRDTGKDGEEVAGHA